MAGDQSDRVAMWQTYVQTAENTSTRREAINRYMIPVHLAIFASYMVLEGWTELTYAWIGTAGVAMGTLWMILLYSHERINKVKYDIICSLESELPCQPFTEEAERSGIATRRRIYPGLTKAQSWGAWIVVGAHCFIVAGFTFGLFG